MWSHVLFTTVVVLLCCLHLGSCDNDAKNNFGMEDGADSALDKGRYLSWLMNRGSANKETNEGSIVDKNRFLNWLMNRGTDNEINVDGTKIDRNRFLSWFLNMGGDTDDKGISHHDLIDKMKSYSPQFQLFFDRLNELLDIFESL